MPFDWSLNPYMGCVHRCTFCYVRAFERRADRPVRRPLRHARSASRSTSPTCCARELARPSWQREGVAIGAATDPYQPAEGRYRLTRACLEVLARGRRTRSRIITRGPMIVRDVDVLAEAARRADVSVMFSVPTLDARSGGRPSPAPRRRGSGCGRSSGSSTPASTPASGWRRSCPGLSDRPEQLAEVVRAAREAGASGIWANLLYLRPGTREHFLAALARDWPEQLRRYERLYDRRRLPAGAETTPVRQRVAELGPRRYGVARPPSRARSQPPPRARAARACGLTRGLQSRARGSASRAAAETEITCLIVDDHEVVREGLRLSLSRAPHIRVDRRGLRRRERRRARRAPRARTS